MLLNEHLYHDYNEKEKSDTQRGGDGGQTPVPMPMPMMPSPAASLGFRCVEHISYPPGVGLDEHEDEDSTFTVSVLLSDRSRNEYAGGDFVLGSGAARVGSEAFSAGDGIVFASEKPHRVERVTGNGTRRVLVVELWPFPDGHAPTRVATPQPFFAFTAPPPRSAPIALSLLPFSSSYVVLRGGLVAAGMLPVPLSPRPPRPSPRPARPMTWSKRLTRTTVCWRAWPSPSAPLPGRGARRRTMRTATRGGSYDTLRLPVWFKREASPIRIKGMEASDSGASYYAQPQDNSSSNSSGTATRRLWRGRPSSGRLADGANGAAADLPTTGV